MSPAELHLGSRIDMRVERDDERCLTIATFRCPCGWWTRTSAEKLLIPDRVKAHNRVCPYLHPGQDPLFGDVGGAA